jgi:hypothetical protein
MLTSRSINSSFNAVAPGPSSFDTYPRHTTSDKHSGPEIEKDSYTPHTSRRSRWEHTEDADVPPTKPHSRLAELEKRLLDKFLAWLEQETPAPKKEPEPVKTTASVTPCEAPVAEVAPVEKNRETANLPAPPVPPAQPAENPVWNFVRTGLNLGLNAGAAAGLGMAGVAMFGPFGLALGGIAMLGLTVSGKEWIK